MQFNLFVRFFVSGSFVLIFLGNTLAQKIDATSACRAIDFKNIALTTNDEQARVKLTEAWLEKFGKNCAVGQIEIIKNNLSAWLGTANTSLISQKVDSLYLKSLPSVELKPLPEGRTQTTYSTPSIVLDSITTNKNIPTQNIANKTATPTTAPSMPTATSPGTLATVISPATQPKPTSKEFALRNEEISQCLSDDIQTWGDGEKDSKMLSPKMVFVYQHQGAPRSVSEQTMLTVLKMAATSWDQCGGTNLVMLEKDYGNSMPGLKIMVDWNDKETVGAIGIANLTKRKLTFSPETVQKIMQINTSKNLNENYLKDTLQMTASHEIGHFQGLSSHSKRCIDVLSYYSVGGEKCITRNGSPMPSSFYEYRSSLPTSCDIERCRIANKNNNTSNP